jgi:hypothetical protein
VTFSDRWQVSPPAVRGVDGGVDLLGGWGEQGGHGALGQVAAVGDLPVIVDLGEHRADQADDGAVVAKTPTTLVRRLISLLTRSFDQPVLGAGQERDDPRGWCRASPVRWPSRRSMVAACRWVSCSQPRRAVPRRRAEPNVGKLGLEDPGRLWSGREVLAVVADVGIGAGWINSADGSGISHSLRAHSLPCGRDSPWREGQPARHRVTVTNVVTTKPGGKRLLILADTLVEPMYVPAKYGREDQ